MKLEKGLVQVYTGSGKGKTTSSLGLALRALGRGLKVYMIQFMKGCEYGELLLSKNIPDLKIVQFGRECFVDKKNPAETDVSLAKKGLEHAKKIVMSGSYDLVILDEINVALDYKLISLEEVLELVTKKPFHVEVVLTGRYAPKEIIKIADLVTEMLDLKHPFEKGLLAREGIDY